MDKKTSSLTHRLSVTNALSHSLPLYPVSIKHGICNNGSVSNFATHSTNIYTFGVIFLTFAEASSPCYEKCKIEQDKEIQEHYFKYGRIVCILLRCCDSYFFLFYSYDVSPVHARVDDSDLVYHP